MLDNNYLKKTDKKNEYILVKLAVCLMCFRPDEDNAKTGLLMVVLSLVFMNGQVMQDCKLTTFIVVIYSYKVLNSFMFDSSKICCVGCNLSYLNTK